MGFSPLNRGRGHFKPLTAGDREFSRLQPDEPPAVVPVSATVAEIAEDAEEASISAQAASHSEGFEEGYREGQDKARAELAATVEAAQSLVDELQTMRKRVFNASRNDLVDLLANCLEWLHLASLETDQEMIVRAVDAVLVDFQGDEQITIHLNPEDHDTIVAELSLGQRPWASWDLTIVQDDTLEPGGCLIKAPEGSVDATVTERLSRLQDEIALLRSARDDGLEEESER